MATTLNKTDYEREREKVSATVELGPRSLALLRRVVRGLEMQLGEDIADPGIASETDEGISDNTPYQSSP